LFYIVESVNARALEALGGADEVRSIRFVGSLDVVFLERSQRPLLARLGRQAD